nr:immunoglobulin heavy chain junction region [Mus musculus]
CASGRLHGFAYW